MTETDQSEEILKSLSRLEDSVACLHAQAETLGSEIYLLQIELADMKALLEEGDNG